MKDTLNTITKSLQPGEMITLFSKNSTVKTTLAINIANNIISEYDNGLVVHIDLNLSTSSERVLDITGIDPRSSSKYIICPFYHSDSVTKLLEELTEFIKFDNTSNPLVIIIDAIEMLNIYCSSEEVAELIVKLKELAKEYNIIIISTLGATSNLDKVTPQKLVEQFAGYPPVIDNSDSVITLNRTESVRKYVCYYKSLREGNKTFKLSYKDNTLKEI